MAWFDEIPDLVSGEPPPYNLEDCVSIFDGKYYAHRSGIIVSSLRPIQTQSTSAGYDTVRVRYQGHNRRVCVHSIICRAFNGPKPSPDHHVLHRNGDKLDNTPENLYWGTPKQNAIDRSNHNTLRVLVNHLATSGGDPKALQIARRLITCAEVD